MKRILKYFLCLFSLSFGEGWGVAFAQNLVPNPSFEVYSSCPIALGEISKATSWYSPTGGTPDYFNFCATATSASVPLNADGYQNARIGNAYAGFAVYVVSTFPDIREYIQAILIDSLEAGVIYRATFYVSPGGGDIYTVDQVGACFTKTAITCSPTGFCLINCTPQVNNPSGNIITDTTNWTMVTETFTATGGEKYITIGNFSTDGLTQTAVINSNSTYAGAYFYVDDVSVYPDSITSVENIAISNYQFQVYPNPNNGKMILDYSLNSNDKGEIVIYDVTGKLITSYSLDNKINQLIIDNEQLNNGVYFYHIEVNNKIVKSDKLVIIK